jgi:hypothetical protein
MLDLKSEQIIFYFSAIRIMDDRAGYFIYRESFLMPPKKKGVNVWKSKGESY